VGWSNLQVPDVCLLCLRLSPCHGNKICYGDWSCDSLLIIFHVKLYPCIYKHASFVYLPVSLVASSHCKVEQGKQFLDGYYLNLLDVIQLLPESG
jgi:hypothetical protein